MVANQVQSPRLEPNLSGGGAARRLDAAWHLEIPPGRGGAYRLAQLDNYAGLERERFPWQPPLDLQLEARASRSETLPGTWGFGLWNDPFSLSLGMGGGTRRFPALPNCAWFFFASPENYLSLQDDLPANGALAAAFHSRRLPTFLLAAGSLLLPLMALPYLRGWLRRVASRYVRQDAASLDLDASAWHIYRIHWHPNEASFFVDDQAVLITNVSPTGPLGLVLWVDNQYAALPPDGPPRYGTLANPEPAWIEVRNIRFA